VPGLQEPYEAPVSPEMRIDTTKIHAFDAAEQILEVIKGKFC
jgi:adenylylsulfate kinase